MVKLPKDTLPGAQILPVHTNAWPFDLLVVLTSYKSFKLASCRLAYTLALLKYKLVNSITLAVVKNGLNDASVIFALPPPNDVLPDNNCENIRALVIIFPDFFSIIYNIKNLGFRQHTLTYLFIYG